MSIEFPPKSIPLLIREFNGRILSGIITAIDHKRKMIRLSQVSVLEVIGLKSGLEPIYDKKRNIVGFVDISAETIIHWEKLPDYLEI